MHEAASVAATDAGEAAPTAPPELPRQRAQIETRLLQTRTALSRSSEGLSFTKRVDGLTEVDLRGRFESASVVFTDGDGERRRTCVDQPAAMDRILGGAR